MKNTVTTLQKQKKEKNKITMLTCYDYSTAKLMEQAGIEVVLVGDSLGQVVLGYKDTISVTMEDMIHHTAAVSRGLEDTFLIADMPFMSYQTSDYDALVNAGRLMKEGHANAVKLEGGVMRKSCIEKIVSAGIPVCGHIGLTPQSVNMLGGFKIAGKSEESAKKLLEDARAVEEAGAFMVVLECVPAQLAKRITESLSIPTIGIGCGADCDGQVLVYQDMLGMFTDFIPKFVKHFSNVGQVMTEAFGEYNRQVKAKQFPAAEHTYKIDEDIIGKLY
ncbi:MAG: 3-methyl-2-oxobutanoate hydroxymethyltransferase [Lachnospiraceae bacterium]